MIKEKELLERGYTPGDCEFFYTKKIENTDWVYNVIMFSLSPSIDNSHQFELKIKSSHDSRFIALFNGEIENIDEFDVIINQTITRVFN